MGHNLKISVSKESKTGGVAQCRSMNIREKLLTKLLGESKKVMVIIPGNTVECLSITEVPEGGVRVG